MKPSILILSDRNETRGPMLEGWIRYYVKDSADVQSAGLEAGKLNLIAAKAMIEAVIDITKHKPTSIIEIDVQNFDIVITLTEKAEQYAKKHFTNSLLTHKRIDYPLHQADEDLEKLKKHRKTVNETEEFAMEFVHANIRKLF
jgi:arsenate reductase